MAKQHAAPQTAAKYAVGWPRQFKVNLQRCFLAQIRNPTDACMRLLISTWVGLFAGESSLIADQTRCYPRLSAILLPGRHLSSGYIRD